MSMFRMSDCRLEEALTAASRRLTGSLVDPGMADSADGLPLGLRRVLKTDETESNEENSGCGIHRWSPDTMERTSKSRCFVCPTITSPKNRI
jgi:hypothetical protein